MTPTSEVGIIVMAVVAMVGAFLMALIKMFERNGAMIECGCCGCKCKCDMRRHETRMEEARVLQSKV